MMARAYILVVCSVVDGGWEAGRSGARVVRITGAGGTGKRLMVCSKRTRTQITHCVQPGLQNLGLLEMEPPGTVRTTVRSCVQLRHESGGKKARVRADQLHRAQPHHLRRHPLPPSGRKIFAFA